jgi:hypothetical protein
VGQAKKPGRPVWLRWSMLTPLALVFIVGGGLLSYASTESASELSAGQCFSFQGPRTSFTSVNLTPCSDPHDAQVVGRIAISTMAVEQQTCHTMAGNALTAEPPAGLRSNVIHYLANQNTDGGTTDICVIENSSGATLPKSLIGS